MKKLLLVGVLFAVGFAFAADGSRALKLPGEDGVKPGLPGLPGFHGVPIEERKVKAKTVSVALSKEQFEAMQEAISNWKVLKARLARMEELSRLIIFGTTPDTRRDKRLTKATLGLGKRPKMA